MNLELQEYSEIAKREANASDPAGLTEYMLEVSTAISRVSEIAIGLEAQYLRKQGEYRKTLISADPNATEARIKASVESLTIDELIAKREAESVLKALHQRFKAVQSALSFRKMEMRT